MRTVDRHRIYRTRRIVGFIIIIATAAPRKPGEPKNHFPIIIMFPKSACFFFVTYSCVNRTHTHAHPRVYSTRRVAICIL